MTAADAASSCGLRLRQSFSRRASRLSASRLLSRSSCRTTGTLDEQSKRGRKRLDGRRLLVRLSVELPRVPERDGGEAVLLRRERSDFSREYRRHARRDRRGTCDRLPRPREQAGRVGQREPDAPCAHNRSQGPAPRKRTPTPLL